MNRLLPLLTLLAGCFASLTVPDNAVIGCETTADCPPNRVCDGRRQCVNPDAVAQGVAGFDISPTSVVIGESGASATINIRLTARPRAAVTLVLASDDGSEVFLSRNIVTFTPDDWSIAQAVVATGERDCLADGAVHSRIVISPAQSDGEDYSGLDPTDIDVVTNDDIAPAGITVTPTTGLETSESGSVTQFSVVVACKPTADVQFALASSDPTEGAINVDNLVFTPDNWAVARVVTVSGRGDCAVDGDVPYTIELGVVESEDPLYAGIDPPDVEVTNLDLAFSRVNITPNTGLRTTELGGQATFSVVLTCAPSNSVTLPLATSDNLEGSIGSVTSVVFTPENWNQPQAVIVSGVDDNYDDGDITYSIITAAMTSTDVGYNGLDPLDVQLTNQDDDTAGLTVTPQSGLQTTEAGGSASFTITLAAAPLSPVQISIQSSNPLEGTVVAGPLVITSKTPLTVTITGVNDAVDDDNQNYTILLGDVVSADPAFNGMPVPDVTVTNDDNDTAAVSATGVNSENAYIYLMESGPTGTTAQASINLASKPLADVIVAPYAQESSEFSVPPGSSLTFTPTTWQDYQYVTLTGKDDLISDTLHISALLSTTTSTDPKYQNKSMNAYVYVLDPTSAKRVYATSATYAANTVSPPDADIKCNSAPPMAATWKAAIVDQSNRRACLTAGCNWVFAPNTTYYWHTLRGVLGVSNASGTFDGSGAGSGFWNGGPYASGYYWTGLDDLFSNGSNCSNWSSVSGTLTGDCGLGNQSFVTSTFSLFAQPCSNSYSLLCVEQ